MNVQDELQQLPWCFFVQDLGWDSPSFPEETRASSRPAFNLSCKAAPRASIQVRAPAARMPLLRKVRNLIHRPCNQTRTKYQPMALSSSCQQCIGSLHLPFPGRFILASPTLSQRLLMWWAALGMPWTCTQVQPHILTPAWVVAAPFLQPAGAQMIQLHLMRKGHLPPILAWALCWRRVINHLQSSWYKGREEEYKAQYFDGNNNW